MLNIKELKFPIVLISRNNVVEFCLSESDLTTCSYKSFFQDYYGGLEVVDSEGSVCIIKEAKPLQTPNVIHKYFGKKMDVIFYFSPDIKKLSLTEFQIKMLNLFRSQKDFWMAGDNLKWIEKIIETSPNISSVIKALTEYYFNGDTS